MPGETGKKIQILLTLKQVIRPQKKEEKVRNRLQTAPGTNPEPGMSFTEARKGEGESRIKRRKPKETGKKRKTIQLEPSNQTPTNSNSLGRPINPRSRRGSEKGNREEKSILARRPSERGEKASGKKPQHSETSFKPSPTFHLPSSKPQEAKQQGESERKRFPPLHEPEKEKRETSTGKRKENFQPSSNTNQSPSIFFSINTTATRGEEEERREHQRRRASDKARPFTVDHPRPPEGKEETSEFHFK